jgi:hypothetical protein
MPKKGMNGEVSGSGEPEKITEIERKIVENLVSLQKIHTNMIERFDKLSDQITSLLNLFEVAAKTFTKQPAFEAGDRDREFAEKIDMLLEQNRVLARGITMMEEKISSSYEHGYEQPKTEDNPQVDIESRVLNAPSPQTNTPSVQDIDDQPTPTTNRPLPRF